MRASLFFVFLRLGLSCFGGPIAHIGYFRDEFVRRRGWLSEAEFAQLLAICQALPGPASSQLGFAVGVLRGGWAGGLLAFLGFTLPSALLMGLLALLAPSPGGAAADGVLHGLKLVAVVVVAHGVVGMARALLPDGPRALIGVLAFGLMQAWGGAAAQLAVVGGGALLGLWWLRGIARLPTASLSVPYGPRTGLVLLGVFALVLGAAVAGAGAEPGLATLAAAFAQSGALVFGGGHVVLPLLEQATVATGWLSRDVFLAGYGAAQAVPGPMFSLAAYLGALVPTGQPGWLGGSVALLALFAPGLLLVAAMLPLWAGLARRTWAPALVAGVNAAVVGLLASALAGTVAPAGLRGPADVVLALGALGLLWATRLNLLVVVAVLVAASVALRIA